MRFFLLKSAVLFFLTLPGCYKNIQEPYQLKGIWHLVEKNETPEQVCQKYNCKVSKLIEINDLDKGPIKGRKLVFVPALAGKPPWQAEVPRAHEEPLKKVEKAETFYKCEAQPCFIWPLQGEIIGTFGPVKGGHNDGIDITAPKKTPVLAAAEGTVIYSGDAIKGYGNLVIIQHFDDIITIYAHNSQNKAKENDVVKQGDIIAYVGQTGAASVPMLHFEIRRKEQPQNPMLFLPKKE